MSSNDAGNPAGPGVDDDHPGFGLTPDGPADSGATADGEAPRGGQPPSDGDAPVDDARQARPSSGSFLRELPFLVVVALALTIVIRAFLVQAFYIPSGSMEQTLLVRDRVLVNKLVYDFRDIRRGEVVVFNGLDSFTPETQVLPPSNALERALRFVSTGIGLGAPGEKDFIKRVIGVPGDRVACCTNGSVTVQPAGAGTPVELEESYLFEDDQSVFCAAGTGAAACPPGAPGVLVPEGRLWVMGDHRSQSSDSRAYIDNADSGTVPQDKVIGRAFVIVWPLSRLDVLSVPDTFDQVEALPPGVVTTPATPLAMGVAGALPIAALRRRRRARAS
jgi:signal peptidase I